MRPNQDILDRLEDVVKISKSIAETTRRLGLDISSGSQSRVKNLILDKGIDFSHFDRGLSLRTGRITHNRRHWSEILVSNDGLIARIPGKTLKRALLEIGRENVCEQCGNSGQWLNKELSLEVDHKDQNWRNNTPENLAILCPNCHSQKTTRTPGNLQKLCDICRETKIHQKADRCWKCYVAEKRYSAKWPTKEVLEDLVWKHRREEIAEKYGVTAITVGYWIKKIGVTPPPRGYWNSKSRRGKK